VTPIIRAYRTASGSWRRSRDWSWLIVAAVVGAVVAVMVML
jgi:hypothetical protein